MLVAGEVLRCASRSQGHGLIRRLKCQGQLALVSADQPLIRIYGGDGEYAEIQFETQDDANAAVERFNEILKKATGIVFGKT